jgi:hypothetical protein
VQVAQGARVVTHRACGREQPFVLMHDVKSQPRSSAETRQIGKEQIWNISTENASEMFAGLHSRSRILLRGN